MAAAIALTIAAKKKPSDPIVMTVAGNDVTLSEFEYLYHKNATQQVEPQSLDDYIDMFVNYKLKVADAYAAGIDTTEAFRSEFEGYRAEIAAPYLSDAVMADSLKAAARSHFADNVDVSHIMFAPGVPAELIDSVYNELLIGADFASMAEKFSIDRASATNGGSLGFITAARYPYAFEDVAYNTPVGEISKPFPTQFGTHIVKVNARQKDPGQTHCRHILKMTRGADPATVEVKRREIDSIAALLAQGADFIELAKAETEDPSGKQSGGDLPWFGPGMMVPEFEKAAFALEPGQISGVIESPFGFHIILCEERREGEPEDEINRQIEAIMNLDGRNRLPELRYLERFRAGHPALAEATDETVRRAAIEALPDLYPDYAHLLSEYRDGMLLYEISNRRVWGVPATDPEGLKTFFTDNASRYAYETPHYKGFVVVAKTDSIGQEAMAWLAEVSDAIAPADYSSAARKRFGLDVRIERVLAARGENPIIDHLVFKGEKPADNPRWAFYAPFGGRIIDAPEEPSDVASSVTADYQKALEDRWINTLRETYPVTINRKVLKKVKPN